MRFLVIIRATIFTEAGASPLGVDPISIQQYLDKARIDGILITCENLRPSHFSTRLDFSPATNEPKVTQGPFRRAPATDLISALWTIEVESHQDAVEWVKRCPPFQQDTTVEIQRFENDESARGNGTPTVGRVAAVSKDHEETGMLSPRTVQGKLQRKHAREFRARRSDDGVEDSAEDEQMLRRFRGEPATTPTIDNQAPMLKHKLSDSIEVKAEPKRHLTSLLTPSIDLTEQGSIAVELKSQLMGVLGRLKICQCSRPFKEPVSDRIAPNYSSTIDRPMDLELITRKLRAGHYRKLDEMTADVRLITENCVRYNGPKSKLADMAREMEERYNDKIRALNLNRKSDL